MFGLKSSSVAHHDGKYEYNNSKQTTKVNFKDGRPIPILDTLDELEVLKRYNMMFRLLACSKGIWGLKGTFIQEELTEKDIGKNIQETILEWSCLYGLEGDGYVKELHTNVQYIVLQAALILTITFGLFVNMPEFSDDSMARAFSALIGFSVIAHFGCVIASTVLVGYINRAPSDPSAFLAFLDMAPMFVVINISNYISDICAILGLILLGYDRNLIDGIIVTVFAGLMVFFIVQFVLTNWPNMSRKQDTEYLNFYRKYCDKNGELKDKYLDMIYGDGNTSSHD